MSLRCPNYYLLLFINKIVVNITDFLEPFKFYKKKILIDFHVNFIQILLICLFLPEITQVPAGCIVNVLVSYHVTF